MSARQDDAPQDDDRAHRREGDHGGAAAGRVEARVRHGWWPGWIWAIPIAALIVVGWLGARYLLSGGTSVTIVFQDAHDLKKNDTNVVYRGTNIGRVTAIKLNASGSAVIVTASIDQSAVKFLRSGTRFWLRGANPSLSDLASLAALLSGPTIVMEPGSGTKTTRFIGLERKPISPDTRARPLLYEVSFTGDVGSLKPGDPVKLRGFTVGAVRDIGFSYDASTGDLSTPSTIALYPSLFPIRGAADPQSADALRKAVDTLIQKGLRARLDRDPPLVGSYRVSLDMVPGAPAVERATVDGLPQIPVASGGGLNSIVTRLNKVPIEQIAQNVLDITHHVDTLVSSPQLKDAIVQLNGALKQIRTMTAKAGPQITALTATLHKAADDLDRTAQSANRLVSGTATQGGIETTLQEIKDAARSIRSLADYLDRHPESLIRGRQISER